MTRGAWDIRHPAVGRRVLSRAMFCLVAGAVLTAAGCDRNSDAESAAEHRETGSAGGATSTAQLEAPAEQPESSPVIVPVVEPAPRPTGPLLPGTTCVTAECHAAYSTARSIHAPVAAEHCDSCHEQDTGGHVYPLKREGEDLCGFCHMTGHTRSFRHEALDQPGCEACHDPHAAQSNFLLVESSVRLVCSQCHDIPSRTHDHGPFASGECTACHQPHESNAAGLLRGGEGPEHCFMCHTQTQTVLSQAPFVHEPATQDCTICHSPHTSDFTRHLVEPIEQLCFECHGDVKAQTEEAVVGHDAVFRDDACANCHDPHAAGRPVLLRARQDELCLECHDREVRAADGRSIPDMRPELTQARYLHGPVRSGQCSACHAVHGGSQQRLLTEAFPAAFYSEFDVENYALCFRCHETSLVLDAESTALTDFRDGNRNLHYVHVNREKGRTCRTCHQIHGSDLPKHMAADVPFETSQWRLPIRFEKTESGGSCTPGCHSRREYSREIKPAVPPPDEIGDAS